MQRYYFDYNATAPLAFPIAPPFFNPSSMHFFGRAAERALNIAREKITQSLDCLSDEVIFTSGATEGNNTVMRSAWKTRQPGQNILITTKLEHDSVLKPAEYLEKEGAQIRYLKVGKQGKIDCAELESLLDDQVFLVSVMTANNEVGLLFPIDELAACVHKKGILFHTDAACALGKMPLSFQKLGVDFLTSSGHKFHSSKGIGLLLVRRGAPFSPLIVGGGQQAGFRGGTENIEGVVGLAAALEFSCQNQLVEEERQKRLRQKWCEGLKRFFPALQLHEGKKQLPGTLHIGFPGISGQTLVAALDLEGVAVSFGSACHSGTQEVSRVLLALGYPEMEAASSIRISFGRMTTDEDVEGALKVFKKVLARM